MKVTASIDPGFRKAAVAVWLNGRLSFAGTFDTNHPLVLVQRMVACILTYIKAEDDLELVIEQMVYRKGSDAKHVNLDKVEASVDMLIAAIKQKGLRPKVVRLIPEKWKRQVPKAVCQKRAAKALEYRETDAFRDHTHDTWDAVGIGLVWLKRRKPGLV